MTKLIGSRPPYFYCVRMVEIRDIDIDVKIRVISRPRRLVAGDP